MSTVSTPRRHAQSERESGPIGQHGRLSIEPRLTRPRQFERELTPFSCRAFSGPDRASARSTGSPELRPAIPSGAGGVGRSARQPALREGPCARSNCFTKIRLSDAKCRARREHSGIPARDPSSKKLDAMLQSQGDSAARARSYSVPSVMAGFGISRAVITAARLPASAACADRDAGPFASAKRRSSARPQ